MTSAENLLVVAMEECAELQQAISKALRFGLLSCHPDTPARANELNIQTEYVQLEAVMLLLERRGVLHSLPLSEVYILRGEKISNIEKHEAISKSLGRIKDDPTCVGFGSLYDAHQEMARAGLSVEEAMEALEAELKETSPQELHIASKGSGV